MKTPDRDTAMHKPLPIALAWSVLAAPALSQGTPVGFEETYALAADREQALETLVPGTEDYYYFHCLHRQNLGALDDVEPLLSTWIQRYGRGSRVEEIENRQALLQFGRDPQKSLAALRDRLGLRFDHQRTVAGEKPDLPTRLDAGLLSAASLARRAFELHPHTVDGFRGRALENLVRAELDDERLMSLLGKLERPDLPGLAALVVRNLGQRQSRGFGSLPIHGRLLLDQLEECAQGRPKLLEESAFVETYLLRLQPSPDVPWRRDAAAREAYLERLWAFAQRLAPVHNSLKAHVLYHRLAHDLALGRPSKDTFLAYLRLPRPGSYVNPEHLRRGRGDVSDLTRAFPTGLDPVGDDEPLVRAYLSHFLLSEDSTGVYEPFVRDDYLRRLFAETKILAGIGDMERWYSLLDDPAYYERLEQRVDLEFPPTQRLEFGIDEPVTIALDVKNVPDLLVKVFEIDALNYYLETGREVDLSIDLDGLVPNQQSRHTYGEAPLRRVRRTFELPELARPGVYVVDFIGNGKSSRAVIHKGRLRHLERVGAAGHVFQVLDDQGRRLPDASLTFGGREYAADERGEILVPFSTAPGTRAVVLRHGERASLATFEHAGESYELVTGVLVEREALVAGNRARIVVRPNVLVNGVPVDVSLLESPVLTITSKSREGVAASVEVRDLALSQKAEYVHEIRVPEGLAELSVTLRGRVHRLTADDDVDLAGATASFPVNGIDATAETFSPLLGRTSEGYVLDLLGKNGEPRADQAVTLALSLRDYADPLHVTLKSDAQGRVHLGALPGVGSVHVTSFLAGSFGAWELRPDARTYPSRVQGTVGETLRVPYQGIRAGDVHAALSLLELRGGAYARDRAEHATLNGGFVELAGLPAGDYQLFLKDAGRHVEVRVTEGEVRGGWAIGRQRMLEVGRGAALSIEGLAVEGDALVVRLANAGANARVTVVATRYLPAFDPFSRLVGPAPRELGAAPVESAECLYAAGREIGDEYRYILDRRLARKFPGNMLRRPGLILNPWALEETTTALGLGGGAGGRFGGRGKRQPTAPSTLESREELFLPSSAGAFPNLDFLPAPARVLANISPDESGVVRVPLSELGPGQLVHALAVDLASTVYATLPLPEVALVPADRRLAETLDPARHLVQQRSIEFVDAGGGVTLETGSGTGAETYDSLASVYELFTALTGDADLRQFAFVLRWPELSEAEKRELYSKHACHELHVFLHEKDPAFFDQVVRPYLANKADKTFLDQWLLDEDLTGYLAPWAFGRLNTVERILLTRRLPSELESGVRHVREAWELLPPDPERALMLFRQALLGRGIRSDSGLADKLGEIEAKKVAANERERQLEGAEVPGAAAPGRAGEAPAEERAAGKDMLELGYAAADEEDAMQRDQARRAEVRRLYRAPDPTRKYVESNYWHRRIHEQVAELIPVNAFWRDFAESGGGAPFVSPHFAQASGSFAEMMLALAFLDLPFAGAEHELEVVGDTLSLRAKSPLLLAVERIAEAPLAEDGATLLVSQDYFDLGERYRFEGNEQREVFVEDELVIGRGYGCKVVLTNPTASTRNLELLLQIPSGAIALDHGFRTRGQSVRLEPYGTTTVEYAFYFPAPGEFSVYPAHVGERETVVAQAEPRSFHVVPVATTVDRGSWEYVSQNGTGPEVLAFLERSNLGRLDLGRIAWRMRERAAFDAVIGHLRARHAYHDVLWSYGLLHGDARAAGDYLSHATAFLERCGRYLDSPLVRIDPVERRAWEMVEYEPLIHARAHRFGARYEILNADLARQYLALCAILCQKPSLDADDRMTVTYYLLLQDRVEDALRIFGGVERAALRTGLQYDYMQAYLAFFGPEPERARALAERYAEHPVLRWRTAFRDVLAQLDEAQGRASAAGDGSGAQRQDALAGSEPALELAVEARRITLDYENLTQCTVSYYVMDLEFLFSANPFVQQESGAFAYVRPNRRDGVALPVGARQASFAVPDEFASANVLVEARAGGLVRRQAYYANTLTVRMIESYGQLEVSDESSGKPLRQVYVKVFARDGRGNVRFHKDGYTDLRGRFDYVSLSASEALDAERFAILVLDESAGATILEAAPPAR